MENTIKKKSVTEVKLPGLDVCSVDVINKNTSAHDENTTPDVISGYTFTHFVLLCKMTILLVCVVNINSLRLQAKLA